MPLRPWRQLLRALRRSTAGAETVQYVIVVGVVALAAIAAYRTFGQNVSQKIQDEGQRVATLQGYGGGEGTTCKDGICTGPNCFVAGTPVVTPDGARPIEQIVPGDVVLSRDEETGEVSSRRVVATFETPSQHVVDVRVDEMSGETIRATPGHWFWTLDHGWTEAARLDKGEALLNREGALLHVLDVTSEPLLATVYNFEVEKTHTYFVGEAGIWVHNPPNCNPPPPITIPPSGSGSGSGSPSPGSPMDYEPGELNTPPGGVNDNWGNNYNNCYYCTAAALLNQTNLELQDNTGIAVPLGQQSLPDITWLYGELGVTPNGDKPTDYGNSNHASQLLNQWAQNQAPGSAVAIAYTRPNGGGGHAITGFVSDNPQPNHMVFVDFQAEPPMVATQLNPNLANVFVYPTDTNVSNNQYFNSAMTNNQLPPAGYIP
jgi:hypothetical protein